MFAYLIRRLLAVVPVMAVVVTVVVEVAAEAAVHKPPDVTGTARRESGSALV